MDVDPMEIVEGVREEDDASREAQDQRKHRLNSWVAIMVALLATFMGICKVKDDNIVQAMQQAQAKSVDYWACHRRVRLGRTYCRQPRISSKFKRMVNPRSSRHTSPRARTIRSRRINRRPNQR